MQTDPLLGVVDAAERIGVHRSYLDRRRVTGGGPVFVRLSARKIAYRASDLDVWLQAQRRTSTSDQGAASHGAC